MPFADHKLPPRTRIRRETSLHWSIGVRVPKDIHHKYMMASKETRETVRRLMKQCLKDLFDGKEE